MYNTLIINPKITLLLYQYKYLSNQQKNKYICKHKKANKKTVKSPFTTQKTKANTHKKANPATARSALLTQKHQTQKLI